MRRVYLDNNATTPLHPEVKQEILNFIEYYGNPSSVHYDGRIVRELVEESRKKIADFLEVETDNIFFTSGGSESNNLILKSILFQDYKFKPHFITTSIEHPSVLNTAKFLSNHGVDVSFLSVDENGLISVDEFKSLIREETKLVSIMFANNEVGVIEPIEEIAKICNERGIFFHSDMVQAAGKIKFKLNDIKLDAASFSAHKIYAPKGIGIIYLKDPFVNKKKFKIFPLIHGGHQEKGLRASTENTIGIIAFGKACEVMKKEIDEEIIKVKNLRDLFEELVVKEISDIYINSKNVLRLPGTSNINFKFIEGEAILLRLDMEGISVSTGSACSSGSLEPSHVLLAMHKNPEMAHGTIRFSFGRENVEDDVYYTIDKLKNIVSELRKISPLKS
ncbi:MAG: cysteine desulfurase [Spirochaetes bacterium]|nr:cysteine desulfurase [Spirochaetota bacterium]